MTPDEWNKKHEREPIDLRELAPVFCPQCGGRMYFTDADYTSSKRVVRCSSKRACVQTTIVNPMYVHD